ncbi:hypothetical protein AJ78_00268 [Emergomyces pasteurianus Ep9510]|uniref:Uncharacterized protein n=1 Tax=Emergomyces pasteurianus Ep9510 TaxID=1447872 RepID=A0A1J9PTP0_9EURO|nr:hypothetical protein AJ78_00268 [Emergomyces pasteurianus Ep9510]
MAVLKDIEDFLDERARGWYARQDINAASTARMEDSETTKITDEVVVDSSQKSKSERNVPLSALLNVLDGVSSQED